MATLGPTKEFGAKIPLELYDEFRELFPTYGSTTWFIENALKCFLAQVRDNPTLQEILDKAIEEMVKERREESNVET